MRTLYLVSAVCSLVLLSGCTSDPSVNMVKHGSLDSCPGTTIGQMADGFMAGPSWRSLVADDGLTYVNLEGGITYDEKPITALIQFLVQEDTDRFEFNALEFNGIPQNAFMALGLLEKMCEESM